MMCLHCIRTSECVNDITLELKELAGGDAFLLIGGDYSGYNSTKILYGD